MTAVPHLLIGTQAEAIRFPAGRRNRYHPLERPLSHINEPVMGDLNEAARLFVLSVEYILHSCSEQGKRNA